MKSSEIRPMKKMVLIQQIGFDYKSKAGLIIDADALGHHATARVLAVGPDCTEVKKGDEVYPAWSSAQIVKCDDKEDIAMINEDNIIGVKI